jgi:hypothetical protein
VIERREGRGRETYEGFVDVWHEVSNELLLHVESLDEAWETRSEDISKMILIEQSHHTCICSLPTPLSSVRAHYVGGGRETYLWLKVTE